MSDMRDRAKDAAIGAATGAVASLAAKGFRGWMSRFAKRPLFKRFPLVRGFRRALGLESDEEIRRAHEEMLEAVQRAADEYRSKPK